MRFAQQSAEGRSRQSATAPRTKMPLVILGGSDGKPSVLPPAGRGKHPLTGYKGADLMVAGKPLIAHLLDRLHTCEEFDPIWICGPATVYQEKAPGHRIIDSDSTLAGNVLEAIEVFQRDYERGHLAFITCDLLPDPAELRRLLDLFHSTPGRDLWYPLIQVPDPDQLRSFSWKPGYRVIPTGAREPVRVLPGHLLIADPRALRLGLIERVIQITYETRNRPLETRRSSLIRRLILSLLWQDIRHLFRLRPPVITWRVIRNGLLVAKGLEAGDLHQSDLERAVTAVVIKSRHRRRHPEGGAGIPIAAEALTLAEDIDTEEEAMETQRQYLARETRPRPSPNGRA